MGRFLLFIIIIAAALAGVWFGMPGGKDMLLGAKDKVMSYVPGQASEEAAPAADETVVEDVVIVEEPAAEEPAAEEAPAEEEAPQI
jgi:hypothetical protein